MGDVNWDGHAHKYCNRQIHSILYKNLEYSTKVAAKAIKQISRRLHKAPEDYTKILTTTQTPNRPTNIIKR